MRIQILGPTRTTAGAMFLDQINGQELLLECGLYQAKGLAASR